MSYAGFIAGVASWDIVLLIVLGIEHAPRFIEIVHQTLFMAGLIG